MIYNYVVWNIVNLDEDRKCRVIHIPVESPEQGITIINAMTQAQLDVGERVIDSNMFGMVEFKDGEWGEWEDADGNTVDDLCGDSYINDPPFIWKGFQDA